MTYVITHGCCNDASCIPVCPVQCIRPRPGDPDFATTEQLYIDPATCIDCGACMDECPVNAIESEWDLPENLEDYLEVNRSYFDTNPIEESAPPDPIHRRLPAERPRLSVAIVGSGPAGCYAAGELSEIEGVDISIFERLPTPFGLVRAGVAPDHANTKLIAKRFGAVLSRKNVQCFFNVEVGSDVMIDELLSHHHAVIWAAGARADRHLGIPGEDLEGSVPAREFVAWYNGHPDFADAEYDLSGDRAVVIGNGNVALDVARILTQPPENLERTDIADHALEALGKSSLSEVAVTARRGPEHAAYTTGELSDLFHTDGVAVRVAPDEVSHLADEASRRAQLLSGAVDESADGTREVVFRYGLTPVSINGQGRVESITFESADGTEETIAASLVVRAIGYRGVPVDEVPFDEYTGTLPHVSGRVTDPETGEAIQGLYCSGWIKRGATGIIGTNKADSAETVDTLLSDFRAGRLEDPTGSPEDLGECLSFRGVEIVDADAWARIDKAERAAGRRTRRPRQKLVTREEMLDAARQVG